MKEFLRKKKEWIFGSTNSLRNKIIKDTFRYFLIYFLIFEILLVIYYYLTNQDLDNIIAVFKGNIVAATITFFIIILSFKKTLQKHVYSRFETIENDFKKIKKGDFSKRITLHSKDEFDQVVFFANSLLDEVEKKIEFEKKYSLMDPLTLTYNRRALNLSFSKFSSRVKRGEKLPLSIFLIDIDHFKSLNDRHGHKMGDEVLKELSKLIKRFLRKDDNLYRIGGEEFIILFFKLAKNKEKILIERLQNEITYNLRKKFPKVVNKITISGGFVRSVNYDISDEEEFGKMIEDADTLLYEAKNNGRNKVLFQK
jgi:diguanylate cyclase (GGDEF)-like protein